MIWFYTATPQKNTAPIITESRFDLQPNEAVLEYRKREKTFFIKSWQ
jgi:hypothetical protein